MLDATHSCNKDRPCSKELTMICLLPTRSLSRYHELSYLMNYTRFNIADINEIAVHVNLGRIWPLYLHLEKTTEEADNRVCTEKDNQDKGSFKRRSFCLDWAPLGSRMKHGNGTYRRMLKPPQKLDSALLAWKVFSGSHAEWNHMMSPFLLTTVPNLYTWSG